MGMRLPFSGYVASCGPTHDGISNKEDNGATSWVALCAECQTVRARTRPNNMQVAGRDIWLEKRIGSGSNP
jgi:hypothetical protein